jgi:hypothetical protein
MPTATRIRDHCLAPGRAVDADGASYRAVDPGWRPTLPGAATIDVSVAPVREDAGAAPCWRSTAPSAGSGSLAGRWALAAEILSGRRVTIRIEDTTLMFFDPDTR